MSAMTRFPGYRKIDRVLSMILRREPRYLSNRVRVPKYKAKGGWGAKIQARLWREHSPVKATRLALLIAIGIVVASLLIGVAFDIALPQAEATFKWASPDLVSIAGYAGVIFGFLQAALLFAAQVRSQQDSSMLPLASMWARKYHAFEILAFSAGIAIANFIVPLLGTLISSFGDPIPWITKLYAPMLAIDIAAIPAMTALSLWMLTSIIADAGETDIEVIRPVMRAAMATAAINDAKLIGNANQFIEELEAAGMKYNPFAHTSLNASKAPATTLDTGTTGTLVDIDCTELACLAEYCKSIPGASVEFAALPGETWSASKGAVIKFEQNNQQDEETKAENREHQKHLEQSLRKIVIVDSKHLTAHATDLRNFFAKLSDSLQALARDGRHVELKAKLRTLRILLKDWLSIAPPKASRPKRLSLFVSPDPFDGPLQIDMWEIADQAVLSGDTTTQVVLLEYLKMFANHCLDKNQYALAQEYLDSLVYLYHRCHNSESSLDAVGSRLDSILYTLLSSATDQVESPQTEPTERIVFAVRFALALLHASIQLRRPRDTGYFMDRLVNVREQLRQNHSHSHTEPLTLTGEVVLDYAIVLAIGFAVDVMKKKNQAYHHAAQIILTRAPSALPSREILIAEWELLHDSNTPHSDIDRQLGVATWDFSMREWDSEYRAGIVKSWSGNDDWQKQGLHAALLLTNERSWHGVDQLCGSPAHRHMWDVNHERNALESLAANDALSIAESDRPNRIEAILAIISKRAQGGNADYLRYVLNEPLSEKRKNLFQQQALDSWAKHRSWIHAMGEATEPSTKLIASPRRATSAIRVPREYFLDDNSWASGFGDHLGEYAGRSECFNLVAAMEDLATTGASVLFLADLPELVRQEIRAMKDAGYSPNCLVLPREIRFRSALFGKPQWKIEGQQQYKGASIGDWEGLHVLKSPYTDSKAILLIDTTKALAGTHSADPAQTRIRIEGPPELAEAKYKAAREALENNENDLPNSRDIRVLAWMEIEPMLGVADKAAIRKLSTENSDGGFALPDHSDLYHKPSCEEIEFEYAQYVTHLPEASGRKPCPKCHPDQ